MVKVSDRDDWFELWYKDKKGILDVMVANMVADLNVGYDYFGQSIVNQRNDITDYKRKIDETLDKFKDMDDKAVNRWCFYDLLKRGVIE